MKLFPHLQYSVNIRWQSFSPNFSQHFVLSFTHEAFVHVLPIIRAGFGTDNHCPLTASSFFPSYSFPRSLFFLFTFCFQRSSLTRLRLKLQSPGFSIYSPSISISVASTMFSGPTAFLTKSTTFKSSLMSTVSATISVVILLLPILLAISS